MDWAKQLQDETWNIKVLHLVRLMSEVSRYTDKYLESMFFSLEPLFICNKNVYFFHHHVFYLLPLEVEKIAKITAFNWYIIRATAINMFP